MIMPCMNSTSAGERGGRDARVDEGRVLLGVPGAPGCTTTGFGESDCCARAAGKNRTKERLAASDAPNTTARVRPGLRLSLGVGWLRFGVRGNIFIGTRRNVVTKREILQPG